MPAPADVAGRTASVVRAKIGPAPRVFEQLRYALQHLHPDDDGVCAIVGPGLKASLGDSGAGLYREWRRLDPEDAALEWGRIEPRPGVGISTVLELARECGWERQKTAITTDDFHAYMPMHAFIFGPTREMWPAASVNAKVPPVHDGERSIKASQWLAAHRTVEQMTWAPGEEMIIRDRLISQGGWISRPGCATFNLYRPPELKRGDPSQATPWFEHVHHIYPDDAAHIIAWLAHRVQRPQEKINHALVLGGAQGIGKDTLLEPVKQAVGPWNFREITPAALLGRFNGFAKSVILRVSEARDLEANRYTFYEHTKGYTAAPPDVLQVDEKNIREYAVFNVCGVVITTTKSSGLYLPTDDRRHFVAWSDLSKDDFSEAYWRDLYA